MCERWDQTLWQDAFRKEKGRTKASTILVAHGETSWHGILHSVWAPQGWKPAAGLRVRRDMGSWEWYWGSEASRLSLQPGVSEVSKCWLNQQLEANGRMEGWAERKCLIYKMWIKKYTSGVRIPRLIPRYPYIQVGKSFVKGVRPTLQPRFWAKHFRWK